MTRKTDGDKTIYLVMARKFNNRLNTVRAVFDPKIILVLFVVDEVALGQT